MPGVLRLPAGPLSVCLLIASGLITDLSSGFKGGIDAAFPYSVGAVFLGGMVLVVVVTLVGFFVAFTDSGVGAIVDSLVQHVAGTVLGVTLIIWSIGDAAALSRSAPAAPVGVAGGGQVVSAQQITEFIPSSRD